MTAPHALNVDVTIGSDVDFTDYAVIGVFGRANNIGVAHGAGYRCDEPALTLAGGVVFEYPQAPS